jgi:hypothetical protein
MLFSENKSIKLSVANNKIYYCVMSSVPDDHNDLHRLVRKAFDDYVPPPVQTREWEAIRRAMFWQKVWNWSAWSGLFTGVIALFFGIFWIEKPGPIANNEKTSKPIFSSIVPRQQDLPQRTSWSATLQISPASVVAAPVGTEVQPAEVLALGDAQPKDMSLGTALENAPTPRLDRYEMPQFIPDFLAEFGETYEKTPMVALERMKKDWKGAVIVCDLTTSMFVYSSQVLEWFRRNPQLQNVKGVVFFTDCDSDGKTTQTGSTGQFFVVEGTDIDEIVETAKRALKNTIGNQDIPENNMEALLHAQRAFPDATELVMIADNSSTVKDFYLWPLIKKPVHIIACGETYEEDMAFQPEYLKLAKSTQGSLHTLEDHLPNIGNIPTGTWVRVGSRYFEYKYGFFFPSKHTKRPANRF